MSDKLSQLLGLTDEQRLDARDAARAVVIRRSGNAPSRAAFSDNSAAAYPSYVVAVVTIIVFVLLAAFFAVSAMRLYTIGSNTFGEKIAESGARLVAGIAIVIGSEAGALGFMLAAGVLARQAGERRILYALAFASAGLALVGNTQFALGGDWYTMILSNPFAVLESILPPVVVLGGGLVFKRLWLDDISRRHDNERAYQAALVAWKAETADPENSPAWQQSYASALKHALIAANGSGRGQQDRRAIMAELSRAEWAMLVRREIDADNWYEHQDAPPIQPAIVIELPHQHQEGETVLVPLSGNGNGRH